MNDADVDETPEPVLDEREALVQSIEENKAELLDAVDGAEDGRAAAISTA